MIARSIGAAPRQRGSSEGWTLRISCSDSSGSWISAPYAQTSEDVGLGRGDPLSDSAADVLGLEELEAELRGDVGDRRRSEPPPATGGPVRAGHDERRAVRRCGEPAQHGCRELARCRDRRCALAAAARGSGRGVLALAQRPHRLAALVARRAVQDQYAVEVVHLVLDHAGLQSRRLDQHPLPSPSCARTRTWTGARRRRARPRGSGSPPRRPPAPWSSTRSAG